MLALILAFAPAFAASVEIDAEAGWVGSPDPALDVYSSSPLLGTAGLRVGFPVPKTERLAIIAGWQRGRTGQSIYVESGPSGGELRSGLTTDQVTLGLKGDVRLASWLYPYATAQGDLAILTARFDDDPEEDDNPGQIKATGVTGGFALAAGVEFPIPLGQLGVSVAPYSEFGYTWLAPATLGDFGDLALRGFSGRVGVGLRF